MAFIPFGNLLKGASGKLIMIAGAILLVVFLIWRYNGMIIEKATAMFNQQQLEETVAFQQREITRLHSIEGERNKAIERAIADNEALLLMINDAKQVTRSFTPMPASPVLKSTLKAISEFENRERVEDTGEAKSTGNSSIDAWKKNAKEFLGGNDD